MQEVPTTVERTVPQAFPLPTAGCISLQSPLAYIYEASVIRAVIATSTHTRLDECKGHTRKYSGAESGTGRGLNRGITRTSVQAVGFAACFEALRCWINGCIITERFLTTCLNSNTYKTKMAVWKCLNSNMYQTKMAVRCAHTYDALNGDS